jgi:PhzF family phenazine biosynthesis protein
MKTVPVYHFDACTKNAVMGNPAGIIFNGDELSEEEMQQITTIVGFNEC